MWHEVLNSYGTVGTSPGERLPHAKILKIFEKSRSYNPTNYPNVGSKGAQGRHAVPVLLDVCKRIASDRPMFQHVVAALEYLSAFYDTVLTHGCFLPAADGRRAKTSLERYLVHYQYLTNLFLNSDPRRRLFYITEKRNHYPWHIAQACEYYNPKQGWTYQDEDFMGKMSQLAASVVRGLGPCRLGPALMWKYRNRVHIRYNRRRRAASLDL